MAPATTFGRRVRAPSPTVADEGTDARGDLYRFLSAFAGGFVFFSILLL